MKEIETYIKKSFKVNETAIFNYDAVVMIAESWGNTMYSRGKDEGKKVELPPPRIFTIHSDCIDCKLYKWYKEAYDIPF